MRRLTLYRELHTGNMQFGVMFWNGKFFSFTLENYAKRIEPGEYEFIVYTSPKRKEKVLLLKDVIQRSTIEIHPANWDTELEGCIAVGDGKNETQLLNSRNAFTRLMKAVDLIGAGTIKVQDYENPSY